MVKGPHRLAVPAEERMQLYGCVAFKEMRAVAAEIEAGKVARVTCYLSITDAIGRAKGGTNRVAVRLALARSNLGRVEHQKSILRLHSLASPQQLSCGQDTYTGLGENNLVFLLFDKQKISFTKNNREIFI